MCLFSASKAVTAVLMHVEVIKVPVLTIEEGLITLTIMASDGLQAMIIANEVKYFLPNKTALGEGPFYSKKISTGKSLLGELIEDNWYQCSNCCDAVKLENTLFECCPTCSCLVYKNPK